MCNFTPSPAMSRPDLDPVTQLAVAELMQAAAHAHGVTGPVEFEVLSSPPYEGGVDDASSDGVVLSGDDNSFPAEWLKDTEAFDD